MTDILNECMNKQKMKEVRREGWKEGKMLRGEEMKGEGREDGSDCEK